MVGNRKSLAIFALGPALVSLAIVLNESIAKVDKYIGSMIFSSYELVALAGTVMVAVLISVEGRTRWLEGPQLLALYLILGLAFYFVP